jgi:hypothetical protein
MVDLQGLESVGARIEKDMVDKTVLVNQSKLEMLES